MTAATPNLWTTRRLLAAVVLLVALAIAGVAAAAAGSAATAPRAATSASGNEIVRVRPGRERAAEALVAKLAGAVRARLPIIDGFSAALPAGAAAELRRSGLVLSVTPDSRLHGETASYTAGYDPTVDGYSMSAVTQLSGARAWWGAGYTGKGVDVALIDSGVSPVQGLSSPGKIVNGPDLSRESQVTNLRYLDTYGHGTFRPG